jgi:hypothetical protein
MLSAGMHDDSVLWAPGLGSVAYPAS